MLIWSFADLKNMDQAIACLRAMGPWDGLRGTIDGNVYIAAGTPRDEREYATGLCRGIAWATKDAST